MVADAVVRVVDVRGLRRQRKTLLRRKHGQVTILIFANNNYLSICYFCIVWPQRQQIFPMLILKSYNFFVSINELDRIDMFSFNKSVNIISLKANERT
jgi:hypothetical protein